ncbi:hypothetical protein ACHAWU_009060 [Discostella pseudostelligera]|uniref:Uncharacterized protein n=1 Tax=Discostella pseudostelligera TaxID=259834 RepID=A0ABD3MHQ5_9STRA
MMETMMKSMSVSTSSTSISTSGRRGSDHAGSSGILMGVNPPPLYEACLVGRWMEVLQICGVTASTTSVVGAASAGSAAAAAAAAVSSAEEHGIDGDGHGALSTATIGGGHSHDESVDDADDSIHPAPTASTAECSSSEGSPSSTTNSPNQQPQQQEVVDRNEEDTGGDEVDDFLLSSTVTTTTTTSSATPSSIIPCLQARYSDRRRNTPLHLACRRQPPPEVIRALLDHSPAEAARRRTSDGQTPLHFAAYCGAGVEVVSILVERMKMDAESVKLQQAQEEEVAKTKTSSLLSPPLLPPHHHHHHVPPTRLFDRRHRTPLHCALSGFRSPERPLVVRKLLSADPASSTLCDERGRTPLSLLFDDYAEEVMEALEEDVSAAEARDRALRKGGELHECWKMLRVLLRAAYQGTVCEDEAEEEEEEEENERGSSRGDNIKKEKASPAILRPPPQDRTRPISSSAASARRRQKQQPPQESVLEMFDRKHFSMVHAVAGVWECPAPLSRLVLKCLCHSHDDDTGSDAGDAASEERDQSIKVIMDAVAPSIVYVAEEGGARKVKSAGGGGDKQKREMIRQPDEENMRLPLHIAVSARPQCREGYSVRLKVWLSSTPEVLRVVGGDNVRRPSACMSVMSGVTAESLLTTSDDRGRSTSTAASRSRGGGRSGGGRVYNPRFGRSPSRDSVAAYSSYTSSLRGLGGSSVSSSSKGGGGSGLIYRSASNSSLSADMAREPFLQHTIVRDILNLYPGAASIVDNLTGKLPIVLAIEHGKSWEMAVGPLLEAYPTPFGGGGDGGMALPDGSSKAQAHRDALEAALFTALNSPESVVREESIRTAGKLAEWGGVYGMTGSLDGIISGWLDAMQQNNGLGTSSTAPTTPEGIIVDPGAASTPLGVDGLRSQSSYLTAVAEVVCHSRPESVSDRVARLCLDVGREHLFSKNESIREAAARVLGNTLNTVGDADDASNIMREVVLNMGNDEGSTSSAASTVWGGGGGRVSDNIATKHGKLLACSSILSTQWGSDLMSTPDICDAVIALIHACVKDKNNFVRSAAYHVVGPILGKSNFPDANGVSATTITLKELRSDILKGTRVSEDVDVQLALARGLTSASRMHPSLFLCKAGMPILDAALMVAMSSSLVRSVNVQKAFQIFLWVALQMGSHQRNYTINKTMERIGGGHVDGVDLMSPGLEKYIALAEGENGRIMLKFVTQTLAKIEDLDNDHV